MTGAGSRRAVVLLQVALVLAVLALPLTWGSHTSSSTTYDCYPGIQTLDAYGNLNVPELDCHTTLHTRPRDVTGLETPARVHVLVGAALVWSALRRRSRAAAAGALVLGIGVVCAYAEPGTLGWFVAVAALVVLGRGLAAAGLLGAPGGIRARVVRPAT